MVYDGIVIGLLAGFIRAGLSNGMIALARIHIRGGWIFPVLLALQLLLFFFQGDNGFLAERSGIIVMLFYVAGLVVLWMNRQAHGFWFIFWGVLLNFLVMLVNGGKMPVSLEAASVLDPIYTQMLQSGEVVSKHTLLNDSTLLPFLGDIIPLSAPYPRTQAISIGDVLMNVGIFMYILHIMLAQKEASKLRHQEPNHITNQPNHGGETL